MKQFKRINYKLVYSGNDDRVGLGINEFCWIDLDTKNQQGYHRVYKADKVTHAGDIIDYAVYDHYEPTHQEFDNALDKLLGDDNG